MRLPTAGTHNVANALGVAAAASRLGLGADRIVAGLASFAGVGAPLERKNTVSKFVLFPKSALPSTATDPADTVVMCTSRRPEDALYVELRSRPGVVRIGDCLAPREADDALFEGFRAGYEIGMPEPAR